MGENDTVDDKTRLFDKLDKIEKRMDVIEEFVGMFKKMMEEDKPSETKEPKEPKESKTKGTQSASFLDDIFEI